jgi:hypothetical protein
MRSVDHTWADPVAMEGRFAYKGQLRWLGIFCDGEPQIPMVGRLCFLSLIHGPGVKFRFRPPRQSNWPGSS